MTRKSERVEHITDGAMATPRARDREACWRLAAGLGGRHASVWAMEFLKAAQVRTERQPGVLCQSLEARTTRMERARRVGSLSIAAVMAGIFMLGYALRLTGRGVPLKRSGPSARAIAVHGEWSTRTRHLLSAVEGASPAVDFAILLGRIRSRPERLRSGWAKHHENLSELPLIIPFTWASMFAALGNLPLALREGLACVKAAPMSLPLRELTAICFRVYNGLVMADWWRRGGKEPAREVIYGITGTADTTLLERAMHATGTRTIHAVHGQATGPNFFGISDLALFRTGYDANRYRALKCYAACDVQKQSRPGYEAGHEGLLLLTNISHPMNPGFRDSGPERELRLLREIGEAAQRNGIESGLLYWKPHPVIDQLSENDRKALRATASSLGFTELRHSRELNAAIEQVRWIVSTPSTIAIEMLVAGRNCLIVDPDDSVLDTALSEFPIARGDLESIERGLVVTFGLETGRRQFNQIFDQIQPAAALHLNELVKN